MAQEMFRPPVHRSMQVLDRAFFQKRIPISAARVFDNKTISKVRTELERSKDVLILPRYQNVKPDPVRLDSGGRCVLLRPQVDDQGQSRPWSGKVNELSNARLIEVIPFNIDLDYSYWSYSEIARAVLPNADTEDFPTSFQAVGHVAHLNLRDQFLPYKHLIGTLVLDKNPGIKTVINKIDDVGEESEYRTFKYELLAGVDDLNVTLKEQDCTFAFDYAKVYWNSRLNTEHERLVGQFKEGEAICDVMAGIGPFAIPAGKKKIFVWANDKNPESVKHLRQGVQRNKVTKFVLPFNEDGHVFIRNATKELAATNLVVEQDVPSRKTPASPSPKDAPPVRKEYRAPKVFSHYVMNLPASAIDFIHNFVGLYDGIGDLAGTEYAMPMIHCYCFDTKSDDNVEQIHRICGEISKRLGYRITSETPDTIVYDVRDVAPKKRMFCASFRLPREVAFRSRDTDGVGRDLSKLGLSTDAQRG